MDLGSTAAGVARAGAGRGARDVHLGLCVSRAKHDLGPTRRVSSPIKRSRSWPAAASTAPSSSPNSSVTVPASTRIYVRFGLAWEAAEEAHLRSFLETLTGPALRPLVVVDVPIAAVYGSHWSLSGEDVPDEGTTDDAVYLPGRNLLLLALPSVWCALHGVHTIALGTLKGNPFPDATDTFFAEFSTLVRAGHGPRLGGRHAIRRARQGRRRRAGTRSGARAHLLVHRPARRAPLRPVQQVRRAPASVSQPPRSRTPPTTRIDDGEPRRDSNGSGLRGAGLVRPRRSGRVAAGRPGAHRRRPPAWRRDVAGRPLARAGGPGRAHRRLDRLRSPTKRSTGTAIDGRFVDLRDHPLQRDHWWGSAEFEAAFGRLSINDILARICADFGDRRRLHAGPSRSAPSPDRNCASRCCSSSTPTARPSGGPPTGGRQLGASIRAAGLDVRCRHARRRRRRPRRGQRRSGAARRRPATPSTCSARPAPSWASTPA